jgi:uncharacterized protein YwbE
MKRSVLATLTAVSVFAMGATVAQAGPIAARQKPQHARIHHGLKRGTLTRGEAKRLEHEQHAIAHGRRGALADGHIGPREAKVLTRAQSRASGDIFRMKHNRRVAEQ